MLDLKLIGWVFLAQVSIVAGAANAFEIKKGDVTFTMNGHVTTNYIYSQCDENPGELSGGVFLCGGEDASTIGNGYLPTSVVLGVKTQKGGLDVSANFAYEDGLDVNQSINLGGDTEANRIWLTVGNDKVGTLLAGRNFGVFAVDAALEDMSLIGVGATASVRSPLNTQLGTAGYGYIFTDRITQMTYSLPKAGNFSAQLGVFQPLDMSIISGGFDSGSESPGFHGKVRYDFSSGFISSSFLSQKFTNATANIDDTTTAFDVTGRVNAGNFSLVGSLFKADGLGHTVLFLDSHDANGTPRESDGYYTQLTYQVGATKYGLNYGVTNLDATTNDAASLLKENTKLTAGVYHTMSSGVMFIAEYSDITAKSQIGSEISNTVFNVGVGYFF